MSLPVKIRVERVVSVGFRAGGRIADVWMPAKEASPGLPGLPWFAG